MCAKPAASPPPNIVAFAAFYVLVGLAFALYLGRTLFAFPLLPFQLDAVRMVREWLLTTVGDYYATSVCLCGVLIATDGPLRGGVWSALVLVLGSPWACAWTAIRLWTHRTLACASAAPSKRPHDDFGAGFVNAFVALYAATGLAFAALLRARSSRTRSSHSSSTTSGGARRGCSPPSATTTRRRSASAASSSPPTARCAAAFGRCSSSCSARRGPARGPPSGCGRTTRSRSSATARTAATSRSIRIVKFCDVN